MDDDHEVEPGCCPSPADDRRAFLKVNAQGEDAERIASCTLAPVTERGYRPPRAT
jgi:hypothetical protein